MSVQAEMYTVNPEFVADDGPIDLSKHVRLAHHVAKRYAWAVGRHLDFDDLVQAGCVGLSIAAQRFEPGRGFKFSTFAFHWVRQCIGRCVAYSLWESKSLDRPPEKCAKDKLVASLDDLIRESERATVGDFVATHDGANYRKIHRDLRETFGHLIDGLTEREQRLAALRYVACWTLEQCAAEIGLTRQRIQQICSQRIEPIMRVNAVLRGYVDEDREPVDAA